MHLAATAYPMMMANGKAPSTLSTVDTLHSNPRMFGNALYRKKWSEKYSMTKSRKVNDDFHDISNFRSYQPVFV
ncbi:hypothetical protein BDQ94DRAFT_143895, partial [Aspergillus welwitschiae]